MEFSVQSIPGVYLITNRRFEDERGAFIKAFHAAEFEAQGLETNFRESYFSESAKNVIRGMHFQAPPDDHAKLITPIQGVMLDVVMDLRKNLKTYGNCISFKLDSLHPQSVYIPKGCAHGFAALTPKAIMQYMVSTVYSPESDTGILWNSIDFDWPVESPTLSPRDLSFVPFNDFESPF